MKTIHLTQGYAALVSDKDYKRVSQYRWCVMKRKYTNYAFHNDHGKMCLMHRFILGITNTKTKVDHAPDFNGLNNQRCNLRIASNTENSQNQRLASNNTSGYKGVYKDKLWQRWVARISVNSKCISLGRFVTAEDAAQAYDKAAIKHFGRFACTNKRLGLL